MDFRLVLKSNYIPKSVGDQTCVEPAYYGAGYDIYCRAHSFRGLGKTHHFGGWLDRNLSRQ